MRNVTENFKIDICTYGRQLGFKIKVNDADFNVDNLNYIKPAFNTPLFKTVMHQVEIDSKLYMPKDTKVYIKVGVKVNEKNYKYVELGTYYVKSCERQEDTNSYRILAYTKMKNAMIDYDLSISENITVRDYLIAICERLGWNTENIPATFINSTKLVNPSLHTGINYTFRDALDEIATITCSFLLFKNDVFYLLYLTNTNETIDESYLDEDNITIGEKYLINSLVFSRAEESDNIYRKDDDSIETNGLHEYRISDCQLLSTNDRDNYIDEMFNYLKTLEFYIFDIQSKGILFLEVCDMFNLVLNGVTYPVALLNNEINIEDGLTENLYMDEPEETETEYKYADSTDKKINQTYILVDKQSQTIIQLAKETSETSEKLTQVEQSVDEFDATVKEINENNQERFTKIEETVEGLNVQVTKIGGDNLIKNSDMVNGTSFWLKHLSKSFTESPTPPSSPTSGDYWYCTSNYETYKEAQMYYYDGETWVESFLTRKQLDQTQNLLAVVSSYENDYTRRYTTSGRIIKFDADDETISTHLFTATNFSDYKENEDYCSLGFKIKNSIKTGFVFISMAFYNKTLEELESNYFGEMIEAMYTKDIVLTPDDLTSLSNVELTTKTPKKNEFIPVYVGTTAPSDTTKKWMDSTINSACVLKEYDEENSMWVVSDTKMSCYDETLRNIYFWTNYVGGAYFPSTINYDENEIKSVAVAITAYGGFLINTEETRPEILPKGWYWLDQSSGGFAWRTQYNGDTFVGWKQTDITTQYVLENTVSSPPYPSIYQVRPTGYFEIADLKLEWNNICTNWTRFKGEVYGKNYKMDEKGFSITAGQKELFMDEDEIISKTNDETVFELTEEGLYAKKAETYEVDIGSYVFKETEIHNKNYLVLY